MLRRLLAANALLLSLAAFLAGPAAAEPLEDSLRAFPGHFAWDDGRQDYIFSDRPGLAALLEPAPEEKLAALAACIDDPRPAAATLADRPVTLGVMCYQALRLVAYVEDAGWPGHIGPLAGADERTAAKRAWQAALAEGRAILH